MNETDFGHPSTYLLGHSTTITTSSSSTVATTTATTTSVIATTTAFSVTLAGDVGGRPFLLGIIKDLWDGRRAYAMWINN